VARRTRGRFELGPPRQLNVKGKAQPVEAYELVREVSDVAARGWAAPFVGRDAELAELAAGWRAAAAGTGWVEGHGELGIGKSRLVEEAIARMEGGRLLTVTATPNTTRRPFGLVRRLVLAVLGQVTSHAPPPETREAFAAALAPLGDAVTAFVDVLWYLGSPGRAVVPVPDSDPQTMRRLLERAVATVLAALSRHLPGLTLFFDAYELADDASAALLSGLAAAPEGLPLPVVVAVRGSGGGGVPAASAASTGTTIRLGRLPPGDAGALLAGLVPGAVLPVELERDILARAAGVPLLLEEMVQSLVDQGALAATGAGGWRWVPGPGATTVSLPSTIRAAMVTRLDRVERAGRELLGQCAVQGVEFDLDVAEVVRQGPARGGAPLAALLPHLERAGLVGGLGADQPNRWAFRQPLMQEACYETLLLRERRTLHAETADALCRLVGGAAFVSPALLAHHYERAERWSEAAEANVRCGDRAAELYLNAEALGRYRRALEAVERLPARSDADARAAALAHRGAALVHLRVGDYARADEHALAMRGLAASTADRAEADRLRAAACVHRGRTEEAERLLRAAASDAQGDAAAREVGVRALYDLAELYHRANRVADALARLAESRAAGDAADGLSRLQADMLEGKIAHTEGRFADAAALYARAYERAEAVGSLSERARAANNLGNAARDLGDYDAAQAHFARALEIWARTGDTECIAGAHNNLGNLAMSRGDFAAATEHHEGSLAACREIGNVHGAALAQANLATLAMEEGDGARAVRSARGALDTLGESGNELLRGLARVVLGEAYLALGDVDAARDAFEQGLREHDDTPHPLAAAGAWRGLGRVALLEGRPAGALPWLQRALETFAALTRAQEAARTELYRAEALWGLGETERARTVLEQALARFVAMRADRDVDRTAALLRRLGITPPAAPLTPP
jgi:predicted ATPase